MSNTPLFNRAAVIGVGLIGGSLAWALRRHGVAAEVVGVEPQAARLERALERALIDRGETDPAQGVAGADLVVVAVPVGRFADVLESIRPALAEEALVTDVGSVKGSVQADAERILGAGAAFVGGHPIAGTADSGVEAAVPGLFAGAFCVLTPVADTPEWAVGRLSAAWQALGSEVVTMSPAEHDRVLAVTSHLPHMLAYALIQTFGALPECDSLERFAAGGFRDLTRIAGSDAVMWRDIALANHEALLAMIDRFESQLGSLRAAIEAGDGAALEAAFNEARARRRGLPARRRPEGDHDPEHG
ncbi:MAG TPA: prephenate dehydrogenase/arogenate dehydrogenase family protein [Gammaproteobacteria bacterium]|nr:prephenate dehydrogenase/arogenate dehydrogenase family protein [Gammaproteobacteria bacterium]